MYEGNVVKANPNGFGRLIRHNDLFVGFLMITSQTTEDNRFFNTLIAATGTGIYVDDDKKVQYEGFYLDKSPFDAPQSIIEFYEFSTQYPEIE